MKLITKIRKADFPEKTNLWLSADLGQEEATQLLHEMILSLPKGGYKLHDREYGTNLIDAIWGMYGMIPSLRIDEATMLGMQVLYPARVYASFTLGLDAIKIK